MSTSSLLTVPAGGAKIVPGQPVPDNPIIPFIEGDGIGVDITPVMQKVVDAAVTKAYGDKRRVHWLELYAGEKSARLYGSEVWLPAESQAAAAGEASARVLTPHTHLRLTPVLTPHTHRRSHPCSHPPERGRCRSARAPYGHAHSSNMASTKPEGRFIP